MRLEFVRGAMASERFDQETTYAIVCHKPDDPKVRLNLATIRMVEFDRKWEVRWLTRPLIRLNGGEPTTPIEGTYAEVIAHIEDAIWAQLTVALVLPSDDEIRDTIWAGVTTALDVDAKKGDHP